MDLVTFLAGRLDEDEAIARDAYYEGQRWITEEEGVYRWPADELVHMADRKKDARHVAHHDPARVLREVEAGRAILAEHEAWIPAYGPMAGQQICGAESEVEHPCRTLRLLAAVWSDHPDYHEDWCPSTSATDI